jgi:prepilin-type processing-associated H-X9-DG protein
MGTPNKTYFCPTRRRPTALSINHNISPADAAHGPALPKPMDIAMTDYAASNRDTPTGFGNGSGIVCKLQLTRILDVTDGTSTTLLVADKRTNVGRPRAQMIDQDMGYTAGWEHDTVRRTNLPPLPDLRDVTTEEGERFGSSHPGGFNGVFADGSVRFIKYAIDPAVFANLGHRSDGQVVTGTDF